MDIWEANKLALFLAFVIPGFVMLKTYELLFPAVAKESSKQLIDAVAYSCINYALMLLPIYAVESSSMRAFQPGLYVAFYVVVFIVAPVAWVVSFAAIRKTEILQRWLPHPTLKPWDYVFSKRKVYWVIVTLKDGNKIGGKFHDDSFVSSAPAPEQIYLEEAWVLSNNGFERPKTDSAGILVLTPDILSVELFNFAEGETDGSQQDGEKRLQAQNAIAE